RKVAKIYLQTFARLSENKVQKRPRRRARILFANVFSAKQRPPRWGCQTTACNVNLLPADRTFLPGNGCHRAKNAEARPARACRAREKTSYSPPTGLGPPAGSFARPGGSFASAGFRVTIGLAPRERPGCAEVPPLSATAGTWLSTAPGCARALPPGKTPPAAPVPPG